MVYLLLGEDLKSKDAKISQIKSVCFKDPQALHFDFEALDAHGLPADTLKKALLILPVLSAKRLVLLRNAHQIKAADAAVLRQFLKQPAAHIDLVLEAKELKSEFKDIAALCTVSKFGVAEPDNVFDMTRLMAAGRAKDALKMLHTFYEGGTHPLQIMGGLVWFWGKEGRSLRKEKFERGLKALEDADLNIKRSRIDPEYAVEKAVVELTGLLNTR